MQFALTLIAVFCPHPPYSPPPGEDRDIAEDLIVNVAVQLLQEFRSTQTCVHLQEHQGHFSFWGEEGLTSTMPFRVLAHQTEVYCYLT